MMTHDSLKAPACSCVSTTVLAPSTEPTEGQRIGDEIDAAMIFAGRTVVSVHHGGQRFIVRAMKS